MLVYNNMQSIKVFKILIANMHAQLHRLHAHHGLVGVAFVVVLLVVLVGPVFVLALVAGVGDRQSLYRRGVTRTG